MTKIIFGRKALQVPTPLLAKAILKWISRSCLLFSTMASLSEHENITIGLICIAGLAAEIEPLFGSVAESKDDILQPQIIDNEKPE